MDGAHFTFRTDAFVDTPETLAANVNGFAGRALAEWVTDGLRKRGFDASPVWPEDHGWDFSVAHAGSKYLGCCLIEDNDDGGRDAQIIIHKSRSMMDKMLGRAKYAADDPLGAALHSMLSGEPGVNDLAAD